MTTRYRPGTILTHYKGGRYRIVAHVQDPHTRTEYVAYRSTNAPQCLRIGAPPLQPVWHGTYKHVDTGHTADLYLSTFGLGEQDAALAWTPADTAALDGYWLRETRDFYAFIKRGQPRFSRHAYKR